MGAQLLIFRPSKRDVLKDISFGDRVAENEADSLASYFVETNDWDEIFSGNVDLIYGPKGAGKSAIYTELVKRDLELRRRSIVLIPAENPKDAQVFGDLKRDPPTSELEFDRLWQLYFLTLISKSLVGLSTRNNASAKKLLEVMREAGLIDDTFDLGRMMKSALAYVRRYAQPREIEPSIAPGETGIPALGLRISFDELTIEESRSGRLSTNDLFRLAREALDSAGLTAWIILDRLDNAFADSEELETNALRALFEVYKRYSNKANLRFKVFLRTDIWDRINQKGSREATHLTKAVELKWDENSLLSLIIRRMQQSVLVREYYQIGTVKLAATDQEQLFRAAFPATVEAGSRKSKTFDWILRRISDGSGKAAPRELIHFFNEARAGELRRLENGEPEADDSILISRQALKQALQPVSRSRVEQFLYPEYNDVRAYVDALKNEKADQDPQTLSHLWNVESSEAIRLADRLCRIGFFAKLGSANQPRYHVPPLYGSFLGIRLGKAKASGSSLEQ